MGEELEKIIINPIQDGLSAYDFRNAINSAISDENNEYSVVSQTNKALDYFNEMNETAESWAVGGTGSRTGEDTDNSKYYKEQSQAQAVNSKSWAVGGTGTRSGENTNNSEYYSGQSSNYAKNSQSWAIGGTGSRSGEETNNSKYYSEQSSDYATNSSNSAKESQSWAKGGTGTRSGEDTNNAKYFSTESSRFANNSAISASEAASSVTQTGIIKQEISDIIDEGFQPGQFPSMEEFITQDIDDRFDLKMPEIEQKIEDEIKEKSGQMLYRNPNNGYFYKDSSFTQLFDTPTPSALYTDILTKNAYTFTGSEYVKIGPTKVFVQSTQPSSLEVSVGDLWYQVV